MDSNYGLIWKPSDGIFGDVTALNPTWTVEPDTGFISDIARRKLGISECAIEFLANGAFNKVYTIRGSSGEPCVMRVTLPVRPQLKTMSERATIEYVRYHMRIPIPRVLHYNALRDDELNFEWMIQEYVAGPSLKSEWRHMSWLKKEVLVRKIIVYLIRMFRKRFQHLGNVYATHDLEEISDTVRPKAMPLGAEHSTGSTGFSISEAVSISLFYNDHGSVDIQRGHYKHSRDWLAARLQLALHDAENISDADYDDDDDEEEHEDKHEDKHEEKQIASRSSTPDSPCGSSPEKDDGKHISSPSSTPASSCGSDSDKENKEPIVNRCSSPDPNCNPGSDSDADADVDSDSDADSDSDSSEHKPGPREATIARVLRLQALIPKLLPSTDDEEEEEEEEETFVLHHQDLSDNNILVTPSHDIAGIIDWECVHTVPLWLACQIPKFLCGRTVSGVPAYQEEFENELYEDSYYEWIEDYEKTQLRELFLREMRRMCPEWVDIYEKSKILANFDAAIDTACFPFYRDVLDGWIDAVEEGEEPYSLIDD
jgi:hypothetical protein